MALILSPLLYIEGSSPTRKEPRGQLATLHLAAIGVSPMYEHLPCTNRGDALKGSPCITSQMYYFRYRQMSNYSNHDIDRNA
jgi:hypothetical protein